MKEDEDKILEGIKQRSVIRRESSKEWYERIEQQREDSRRKDCSEYGDCFQEPHLSGCIANCPAYNKTSSIKESELRKCECNSEENKLELAHVTYAHWVVKCHACGALSNAAKDKDGAAKLWDDNNLARDIDYRQKRIEVMPTGPNQIGNCRIDSSNGASEYFEKRFRQFNL